MSEEFMHLRVNLESVAAEGKEFPERLRSAPILGLRRADSTWACLDPADRETADRIWEQLRALAVQLYQHLAASPLLGPPDHRSIGDHLRTMEAAMQLRRQRPRHGRRTAKEFIHRRRL